MKIELVTSEPLLSQVRDIFREYQLSLGIDLCYENFEEELSRLPDKYAPPAGRLYLAVIEAQVAGCIALKPYKENQCEMKRLYVRPQYRGQNLGRLLASQVIEDARKIGYRRMLLETLPSLKIAQELYRSIGFCEIPAYSFNPEGAKHLGLDL